MVNSFSIVLKISGNRGANRLGPCWMCRVGVVGRGFRDAARFLLALDFFVLSPWAWPVRGAVHLSRGEVLPGLLFGGLGLLALGLIDIGYLTWSAGRPARRRTSSAV